MTPTNTARLSNKFKHDTPWNCQLSCRYSCNVSSQYVVIYVKIIFDLWRYYWKACWLIYFERCFKGYKLKITRQKQGTITRKNALATYSSYPIFSSTNYAISIKPLYLVSHFILLRVSYKFTQVRINIVLHFVSLNLDLLGN